MSLRLAEGIHGTWFYHLTDDPRSIRGLCGSQTMYTGVPLRTWGYRGHLNERYCSACAAFADAKYPGWNTRTGDAK